MIRQVVACFAPNPWLPTSMIKWCLDFTFRKRPNRPFVSLRVILTTHTWPDDHLRLKLCSSPSLQVRLFSYRNGQDLMDLMVKLYKVKLNQCKNMCCFLFFWSCGRPQTAAQIPRKHHIQTLTAFVSLCFLQVPMTCYEYIHYMQRVATADCPHPFKH